MRFDILRLKARVLDPILIIVAKPLHKVGLNADFVSFVKALFLIAASYFVFLGKVQFAVLSLIFALFFDVLDGAVARLTKLNKYGFLFDVLLDYFFAAVLVVSLYSTGLLTLDVMSFFLLSFILLLANYLQVRLLTGKDFPVFTIGVNWIVIVLLLVNSSVLANTIFLIVAVLQYIDTVILIAETQRLKTL